MLPVRCYTCNKVLGHLESLLEDLHRTVETTGLSKNEIPSLFTAFFEHHSISRYCCRRILLTTVPNLSFHPQSVLKNSVPTSEPIVEYPSTVVSLPRPDDVVTVMRTD